MEIIHLGCIELDHIVKIQELNRTAGLRSKVGTGQQVLAGNRFGGRRFVNGRGIQGGGSVQFERVAVFAPIHIQLTAVDVGTGGGHIKRERNIVQGRLTEGAAGGIIRILFVPTEVHFLDIGDVAVVRSCHFQRTVGRCGTLVGHIHPLGRHAGHVVRALTVGRIQRGQVGIGEGGRPSGRTHTQVGQIATGFVARVKIQTGNRSAARIGSNQNGKGVTTHRNVGNNAREEIDLTAVDIVGIGPNLSTIRIAIGSGTRGKRRDRRLVAQFVNRPYFDVVGFIGIQSIQHNRTVLHLQFSIIGASGTGLVFDDAATAAFMSTDLNHQRIAQRVAARSFYGRRSRVGVRIYGLCVGIIAGRIQSGHRNRNRRFGQRHTRRHRHRNRIRTARHIGGDDGRLTTNIDQISGDVGRTLQAQTKGRRATLAEGNGIEYGRRMVWQSAFVTQSEALHRFRIGIRHRGSLPFGDRPRESAGRILLLGKGNHTMLTGNFTEIFVGRQFGPVNTQDTSDTVCTEERLGIGPGRIDGIIKSDDSRLGLIPQGCCRQVNRRACSGIEFATESGKRRTGSRNRPYIVNGRSVAGFILHAHADVVVGRGGQAVHYHHARFAEHFTGIGSATVC